jgi:hypothetical protein
MLATGLTSIFKVIEIIDRSEFMAIEEEWNELVALTKNEHFYRHEYFQCWLDNFAAQAQLRILIGRDNANHLVAALPMIEEVGSFYGLPVLQLRSAANEHSARFDLIAQDPESVGWLFFQHLANNNNWDLLKIIDVPDNGNAWWLYHAAQRCGYPVGVWQSQNSPYINLPHCYENLYRSKNLKGNLRKRRNRLKAMGKISIEHITQGNHLDEILEISFAIEQSGWKGKNGTAILQNTNTKGFYTQLAHAAAKKGYLSIYLLKLNGEPIAFHFGLTYQGRHFVPKIGYKDGMKDCSPGLLLLEEVIKDCIDNGLTEFDFLGQDMSWKKSWTKQTNPHHWLFIFRNNMLGHALCKAKFNLLPAAKSMVNKLLK